MDPINDKVFSNEIDTVRALHQTVVSLRTALERSRDEIEELKVQICLTDTRQRTGDEVKNETKVKLRENTTQTSMDEQKESDHENDEVDDIELIFTTDETTSLIKEELVSIADANDEGCDTPVLLNYRSIDYENDNCLDDSKEQYDDDVFQDPPENTIPNSKSDISINRDNSQHDKSLKSCYSYQDSSFENKSLEKDESFDKFEEKDKYLHKMWSNNSVLVETDISKCGIVDPEMPISTQRRNTCPNPVPYRPIMHREALKQNRRTYNKDRPILTENQSPKCESEAQTDISALPNLWKSESYLAHKVAHQFTTLPSKFPMPIIQKSLRLSEKTKEARRVLLSDINFTSMVPELSRSADHLYQENVEVLQSCGYGQYLNPPGPQLRRYNTGDSLMSPSFLQSQKFTYSPSDYSNFSSSRFDNSNGYLSRARGSLSSMNQASLELPDRRRGPGASYWRHNVPSSFDNSKIVHSESYRSVPNSPTRSRSVPFISSYGHVPPTYRYSAPPYRPGGYRCLNGSLPELGAAEWSPDSGDSTDSLVDEAECYLRNSIDCIVTGADLTHHVSRPVTRRSSAPCPTRESSPPGSWQPFLPRGVQEVRCEQWAKVIGPGGRVRGGRVRYAGPVLGHPEPHVAVQLAAPHGDSDGLFNGRRYFHCPPNHALFVPFKKLVMGWRN